jgi:beta-glucosidase-like glycosyl hydrolase
MRMIALKAIAMTAMTDYLEGTMAPATLRRKMIQTLLKEMNDL